MFKKAQRIKNSNEIAFLIKNGKTYKGRYLLLTTSERELTARFAVSIAKKLKARGVVRNKYRRQMYSALASLDLPSADYFLVLLAIPRENVYQELVKDISYLTSKLKNDRQQKTN